MHYKKTFWIYQIKKFMDYNPFFKNLIEKVAIFWWNENSEADLFSELIKPLCNDSFSGKASLISRRPKSMRTFCFCRIKKKILRRIADGVWGD